MSRKDKAQSVPEIRQAISELKAGIADVENAGLPLADIRLLMTRELQGAVSMFREIQHGLAECLRDGRYEPLGSLLKTHGDSNAKLDIAVGGALMVYGLDTFMDEAEAQAGEATCMRLTGAEKQSRLAELRAELYAAELAEEALVEASGQPRRSDCNTAAVLGIPHSVMESSDVD